MKICALAFLILIAMSNALANSSQSFDASLESVKVTSAQDPAPPIAARLRVIVKRMSLNKSPDKHEYIWYFYRDPQQIALLKGNVDEIWYLDAQKHISFERVFHDDACVVDYSTGELATLHVNANWAALSRFVDPAELSQLKLVFKEGKGNDIHWNFRGKLGNEYLEVVWSPALELPLRLTRHIPGSLSVNIELIASAKTPQLNWPAVGDRSVNYLHIDAADFGDMEYEPVVRKSEALDMRLGWRALHNHK